MTTIATTTKEPTVALNNHSNGWSLGLNVSYAMGPPTTAMKKAKMPASRCRYWVRSSAPCCGKVDNWVLQRLGYCRVHADMETGSVTGMTVPIGMSAWTMG